MDRSFFPEKYQLFNLDLELFKSVLSDAPSKEAKGISSTIVEFPMSNGEYQKFRVTKSSIMEPGLQEKYPEIQTYKAIGIDDPTATMRFSVTQFGLHTFSLSGKRNAEYIDPYTEDSENYIVFNRSNLGNATQEFECTTENDILPSLEDKVSNAVYNADDSTLRTYRLAQSCTAQYGNIFATNAGTEVADIQAQMAITINRVNEIYERDLAITLVFVDNNDSLIYYGSTNSDPWTYEYNTTTQNTIDSTIGSSNYDIGHNFNTSGGGSAGCIGCVCIDGSKGSGYTGSSNPVGDAFYIDYVAHEMGHQFGGYHTMNTCSRSGNGYTEVEPASGSSIMGYAGICSTNVQSNSDAHFNYVNIRDILDNVKSGTSSSCAQLTTLSNLPPTADAGNDYTIPVSTAFVLEGSATDPDGTSTLTYNWSQNDPEQAPGYSSPQSTWTQGPLYRAILPTDSPKRYLPSLEDVVDGDLTPTWEVTPSVSRVLNFSFVVRDNGSGYAEGIGQTDSDLMTVTVDDSAGPFTVTSQSTSNIVWYEGQTKTITWNVANTNVSPINATEVDIYLSDDAGLTFDILLASNVTNNGSTTITVPSNVNTDSARIMVKASDNIFYALNVKKFSVVPPYTLNFTDEVVEICNETNADFNFTYTTNEGFSEVTTFSIPNLPTGLAATFTPNTASTDNTTINLNITGVSSLAVGSYEITLLGTTTSNLQIENKIYINKYDNNIIVPTLLSPADNSDDDSTYPILTWDESTNTSFYTLQISDTATFSNILIEEQLTESSYDFTTAVYDETYYWRVKANNYCTESNYSTEFQFTFFDCILCASEGSLDSNITTTLVSFNTINNVTASTKTAGYSDFTTLSTTIQQGESYPISINVNTDGNFTTNTVVWIDWNQDCIFGTDEMYDLGTAQNVNDAATSLSTLNITVPTTAELGETIMRVSTKLNGMADSCELAFDGEVEDYTVIIDEELAVSTKTELEDFVIWPNPSNGQFTISLETQSQDNINVNIYDISGRRIYTKGYNNQSKFEQSVSLNNVQAGVYFVMVQVGSQASTKKIIID